MNGRIAVLVAGLGLSGCAFECGSYTMPGTLAGDGWFEECGENGSQGTILADKGIPREVIVSFGPSQDDFSTSLEASAALITVTTPYPTKPVRLERPAGNAFFGLGGQHTFEVGISSGFFEYVERKGEPIPQNASASFPKEIWKCRWNLTWGTGDSTWHAEGEDELDFIRP